MAMCEKPAMQFGDADDVPFEAELVALVIVSAALGDSAALRQGEATGGVVPGGGGLLVTREDMDLRLKLFELVTPQLTSCSDRPDDERGNNDLTDRRMNKRRGRTGGGGVGARAASCLRRMADMRAEGLE